jgi:prevent-host-death family protein
VTEGIKITDARMQLADIVNRVVYGRERILLMRHGRAAAAVVTVEDYELLESLREQRIDLTSTGAAEAAPHRIAAEYRPVQPKARPGFRS